jgi:hypothetical protein
VTDDLSDCTVLLLLLFLLLLLLLLLLLDPGGAIHQICTRYMKAYCITRLHRQVLTHLQRRETPLAGKGGTVGREMAGNFVDEWRVQRHLKGSATWDRRLYFLSEGTEDVFALKNRTASVGFEPANLGTIGQHANP